MAGPDLRHPYGKNNLPYGYERDPMRTMKTIAASTCVAGAAAALVLTGAGSASAQSPGGIDFNRACRDQFQNSLASAFAQPDGVRCGLYSAQPTWFPDFNLACDMQYGLEWFPMDRAPQYPGQIRPVNCARWIQTGGSWQFEEAQWH
jgi:hypothetical protein